MATTSMRIAWNTCLYDQLLVRPFQRQDGGSDMILTRADMRSLRSIGGDGNCLFRALCYIISGSEAQHGELRRAIVAHNIMRTITFLVSGTEPDGNRNYLMTYDGGYHSVDDYLARSDMAENGVWGGDFEMCILAHMLDTPIYSYQADNYTGWVAFLMPLTEEYHKMSMCIHCIFS